MKKAWIWILAVMGIVLLVVFKPRNNDAGGTQKNQKAMQAAVIVEGRIVKPAQIAKQISVSGSIVSNEEVTLQSQLAGVITHIYFTEGTHVNKGDMLIKIDDAQLQAQLQKDYVAKQLAEVTEQRQKKLLAINGISQQDYDIAYNNLNSILADIKLLQVQINYTEIRAPFDGIMGIRNISEGSYVSQNTVLVNIEETSPIKIDFFVPEKYQSQVQKSEQINFHVSGYTNLFTGKIYAIDPKIDENTRSIHVRALSDNKDGHLLPGAFANINIELSHSDSTLMIPTEAIVPQISGQLVYIARNGMVSSSPVDLGIRTDSTVEIVKGLKRGDTILTRGLQLVHPGSAIKFKSVY
jgi:membrane fusion protein (multidrug efflux system)